MTRTVERRWSRTARPPEGRGGAVVAAIFPNGNLPGSEVAAGPVDSGGRRCRHRFGSGSGSAGEPELPVRVEPLPGRGSTTEPHRQRGSAVLLISLLGDTAALVVRLRRSHGLEREQLAWFAVAASLVAMSAPIVFVLWQRTPAVAMLISLAGIGLPTAAGIAILRYRLYDIDVVIKSTLVYAARTLEWFTGRLRHELDLEQLGTDLRAVVSGTMTPTQVSLWLRAPGRAP